MNNVLEGALGDGHAICGDGWRMDGQWRDAQPPTDPSRVQAVVRVESVEVSAAPLPNGLQFEVEGAIYLGDRWEYRLARGDLKLRAFGSKSLLGNVWCSIPEDSVWIFNP